MRSLAFACSIALAATGPGQQVLAPTAAAEGAILATKDGLLLPAGELTVAEVIDATARFLCRNYLFDLGMVDQVPSFTLQRPLALDAIGSEEILAALLASRGLAALPIDELRGVYEVVSLTDPDGRPLLATVPWRSSDDILRRPRLRELVMTAVELQHADAAQLANALRIQYSLQGSWQPGMPTASAAGPRLLLLHGYRDQVAATILAALQFDRLSTSRPTDDLLQRLERLEAEVAELRRALAARPNWRNDGR
ncbi:MAG: hypothetical protein MUC36_23810 [Planctomycetes bacterium]|jgi:hypothetical protein|nr:hypothetical protein [Planctomycetota bacterium]